MPQNQFVVKYNDAVELYMIFYSPNYYLCEWGAITHPDLLVWSTLGDARAIATSINSGTVGLPKP